MMLASAFLLCGCDPTEQGFVVNIQNDLTVPVTLEQCGNGCSDIVDTIPLQPGGSAPVNAVPDIPQPYLVQIAGHPLQCLRIIVNDRAAGISVPVSGMQPVQSPKTCG